MSGQDHEVLGAAAGEMRQGAREAKAAVRLSAEQWAEADAAYIGGETAGEVARRFGVAANTVYLRFAGERGKRARRLAAKRVEAGAADGGVSDVREARARLRVMAGALATIGQGLVDLGRQVVAASGVGEMAATRIGDGAPSKQRRFSPEVWEAAKRDYEEGDFTAAAVEERYGIVEATLRYRAWKERWSKTVTEAPPPLLPPDDPAQVDEAGRSAWPRVAHAAQLAPEGDWATWLFQGGRGAGKTRAGAEWLAARAEASPNGRFAIVAPTEHDLREVMIEGPSGLRSLHGRERPKYESSRRKLRWLNGAVAYGFSAEQPERLRGPQFEAAWADEFCAWRRAEAVLSNLRLGLRMGADPRLVVTTTPKPVASLRRLIAETSCVVTRAATAANAANLTARFLSGLETLYGGTRLAEQELMGVLVEGDGVLWKAEEIARVRGARPARFDRVVVAVDPPAGTDGSACGIVVAGRLGARGYVLADRSVVGLSPLGWAHIAVEAAREFGARKIVAEANQGGDMVRATLAAAEPSCAVELVRASKGKRVRAEPVSALYERGLVTHCGTFTALEEEMLALGGASEDAPGLDRADALVWALSALMLGPRMQVPRIELM